MSKMVKTQILDAQSTNNNSISIKIGKKVFKHKYITKNSIKFTKFTAIALSGAAVFIGGFQLGDYFRGAPEVETIIIKPVELPTVNNDFCLTAPVTCEPFMSEDEINELHNSIENNNNVVNVSISI